MAALCQFAVWPVMADCCRIIRHNLLLDNFNENTRSSSVQLIGRVRRQDALKQNPTAVAFG